MCRHLVVFVAALFIALASATAARAQVYINNDTDVTIEYQFKAAGDPLGWSPIVKIKPGEQHRLNQDGSDIRFHTRRELKEYYLAPGEYDFKETTIGTVDLYKRSR